MCTGHHAAVCARVSPETTVTVVGDGAVGLCAVLAARRLGAERIILMGRHGARTDLGREFGATDGLLNEVRVASSTFEISLSVTAPCRPRMRWDQGRFGHRARRRATAAS